jgi:hypothetical protein
MKIPPLILGACLLFWGWQIGQWPLAAVMALVLEGSRVTKFRLDLSQSDFTLINNLCVLLFVGMFVYFLVFRRSAQAILVVLQWLPLTVFPLLMAQVYSTSDRIDISALFIFIRRKRTKPRHDRPATINLAFPYFGVCILSASAANVRSDWFYMGLFALIVWGLWSARQKRSSPFLWVILMVVSGTLGYVGHVGLHHLQTSLEQKTADWYLSFFRKDADPSKTRTAIGDVGSLKLSDHILFRVKSESEYKRPILLREASYDAYRSSMWFASHARFEEVNPHRGGATWKFRSGSNADGSLIVYAPLRKGRGLLPLPVNTVEIANLPVLQMKKNRLGTVKVEEGPGLATYRVRFDDDSSLGGPPTETDLLVPESERDALSGIIQDLNLATLPPKKVLKQVSAYFQKNFKYSLSLTDGKQSVTPLSDFLARSRSGHCEYFATATTLLLREAGVPARYVVGYSVQELSNDKKLFVVRERHAHAWVQVYLDGTWQNFDTTPASWVQIEKEEASLLEPVFDLWSWCTFKVSKWRWREKGEGRGLKYVWLLPVALLLVPARRLYSRKKLKYTEKGREIAKMAEVTPGLDSEFYLIEKRLMDSGFIRYPGESLSEWVKRIEITGAFSIPDVSLHSMLALHYRYRFDPEGITLSERTKLKSLVHAWLHDCK